MAHQGGDSIADLFFLEPACDAEVAAVGVGLRHLLGYAEHPADFMHFADLQAALRGVQNDVPGCTPFAISRE